MPTRIYHWKHGWIPLDHAAALSKAKGSELGARHYLGSSHAAGHTHESVVTGSYGGGTHIRGLQPVAAEHLPRERHITAAFDPTSRQFALLDDRGTRVGLSNEYDGKAVTAAIPEAFAEQLHSRGYKISGVRETTAGKKILAEDRGGNLKLFAADGSDRYSVDHNIGGDEPRTPGATSDGSIDHRQQYHETHTIKPSATNDQYSVIKPSSGFGADIISRKVADHITNNDHKVIGYQRRVITTVDREGVIRRFKADGSNVDKPVIARKTADFKAKDIAGFTHVPAHEAIPDDNSPGGNLNAGKVKRAYVKGNVRVLLEPQLTDAQTEQFLGHVNTALAATRNTVTHPVTIHVPTGNRHFRQAGLRGYVFIRDQHRVHINPNLARGEGFDANEGTRGGLFSSAANDAHPVAYTITHELGHTVDNRDHHTMPGGSVATSDAERAFFSSRRDQLSRYGATKMAEGYAESFAHYHLRKTNTGSANDKAADAYAARYRWRS